MPRACRLRILRTSFLAVVLFVLSDGIAGAIPIAVGVPGVTVDFDETPTAFTLTINGGAVNTFEDVSVSFGAAWRFDPLLIFLSPSSTTDPSIPDTVVLGGLVRHMVQADPDDIGQGSPLDWAVTFDPTAALVIDVSPSFPVSEAHPPHSDVYGLVASMNHDGRDIADWSVIMTGVHNPVPEPATLLLLGSGLASIVQSRRVVRRRRVDRTSN